MADLRGSKTGQHRKEAFAAKSQAYRCYLYFASKAVVEGSAGIPYRIHPSNNAAAAV